MGTGITERVAEFERGAAALERVPAAVWVEGLAGTAKWFVAGALAERLQAPLLIIAASEEAAELALDDLPGVGFRPDEVGLFPSVDTARSTSRCRAAKVLASSEAPERRAVARTRLAVLEALSRGELRAVVAPVHAVMRETLASLEESRLTIRRGARARHWRRRCGGWPRWATSACRWWKPPGSSRSAAA